MSPLDDVVMLSRWQFGLTAMYHFLFVPLTLGLSWILVICESTYVMTGREIYRDMTRFWGKLFGINFAMGVATGLTMEFQFGTNWAYYAHYVGDIFGAPLAIEGLMAFFLESTFVGLFFFGWNRLSRVGHLVTTFLLAFGTNLSALWILIANGWMQNPVGAHFNEVTMRMELTSLAEVVMNPVAQAKFVHTVAAGYTTGSMFVLGVSAWYLLRARDTDFAIRSFAIAAGFGLASALSVIVLGDESGYTTGEVQKVKLAAIESEWETEKAPAAFTLFGLPNQEAERTDYAIRIPFVLGLIATRSLDGQVTGLKELKHQHEQRIRNGMLAYAALARIRAGDRSAGTRADFDARKDDLGFGLLLARYAPRISDASDAQIRLAVEDSIPRVLPLFWSFRGMVLLGIEMLFVFAASFYFLASRRLHAQTWLLRLAVCSIPLPWVAVELGWYVAEGGRQPWTISGILPTQLSASSLSADQVWFSLIGLTAIYTALLVVEMTLMMKYIRLGPSSLHTGRYHGEAQSSAGGLHPADPGSVPA